MVLYSPSAFVGEIIFVIGSIRFNQESMDIIFLQIIGTTPETITSFSPIGRNVVIPQTNIFSERKSVLNCKSFGEHNSSYYQPQPAADSSYYQPQPTKYNQHQQYLHDRRTKQACSKK